MPFALGDWLSWGSVLALCLLQAVPKAGQEGGCSFALCCPLPSAGKRLLSRDSNLAIWKVSENQLDWPTLFLNVTPTAPDKNHMQGWERTLPQQATHPSLSILPHAGSVGTWEGEFGCLAKSNQFARVGSLCVSPGRYREKQVFKTRLNYIARVRSAWPM